MLIEWNAGVNVQVDNFERFFPGGEPDHTSSYVWNSDISVLPEFDCLLENHDLNLRWAIFSMKK